MRTLHLVSAVTGLVCIAIFWSSTVVVELLGGPVAVLGVKTAILWGCAVLIPAMALTGITGFRMGGRSTFPPIVRKRRRMPFIALNGLFVLVPCAFYLQAQAATGNFGSSFAIVQGIEIMAGAINLALMGLNMRDGIALARRRNSPAQTAQDRA